MNKKQIMWVVGIAAVAGIYWYMKKKPAAMPVATTATPAATTAASFTGYTQAKESTFKGADGVTLKNIPLRKV